MRRSVYGKLGVSSTSTWPWVLFVFEGEGKLKISSRVETFGTLRNHRVLTRDNVSLGEPLLNADGKPPWWASAWFIWAVAWFIFETI